MKWIIYLFVISLPYMAVGQSLQGYATITYIDEFLDPTPLMMRTGTGDSFKTNGSPLIYDDFTRCNIFFSNKTRTTGTLINYNCHTEEVLYSKDSDTYVLDPKMIEYLEFMQNEKSVIFRHILLEDLGKRMFLQVLYDGPNRLYKRHSRKFRKADYGGAYSAQRHYDEYINLYNFYIALDEGNVQLLKPQKKNLLNIMHLHRKEIEAFLKKENINLKSDEDMISVVKYYGSLATL